MKEKTRKSSYKRINKEAYHEEWNLQFNFIAKKTMSIKT